MIGYKVVTLDRRPPVYTDKKVLNKDGIKVNKYRSGQTFRALIKPGEDLRLAECVSPDACAEGIHLFTSLKEAKNFMAECGEMIVKVSYSKADLLGVLAPGKQWADYKERRVRKLRVLKVVFRKEVGP